MGNTIFNIRKTFNFGFFIILCLTVFFPFNTLSQTGTLQFTEEEKAWISSHPVINVGNERFWPPMDFVKDGEPMGYSIDLMNLIAQALGIEINYINGLSWSELLDALNNGTIDVLPAISKTDEREAYIKFSKSYIKLPYVKVINGALPNSEDSKLENKTIAVFEGSNVESALINEYPNIKLIYLKTVIEALRKVSTGEVDIFIENLAVIMYYLNESYVPNIKLNSDNLTFLNSPDVFIGVLKKNKILGNLIDKGLEAVSKEDIVLLKNKWLPIETSKPEILLTDEERQWISSQAPLKVANEMDLPPFNFSDNGIPKGYSVELIKLISKKLDLPIDFVDGNTWAEIIEKFKLGELDILPFVHFTEERNEFMSFTKSYESNHSVLVVNERSTNLKTLDDLEFKKVAVISNYATAEILKNKYPNIEQVFVNNITEALTEVSLGNADGFVGTLGTLSYILDQSFIPNIKIVGVVKLKTKEEIQIHIAVAKDSIIFRNILQKGLDAISKEEINRIRRTWIGNKDNSEENFQTEDLLTNEEKQWISNQPPMKVANSMDWPPFNFSDNGVPKGYSIDLLKLISEKTGLPLQFVSGNTWEEIIEKFKLGELDILPSPYYTDLRNEFILFTTYYASNPSVLVVNLHNTNIKSLEDLEFKKVAVISGYATAEVLKTRHPNIEPVYVKNAMEGLYDVSIGNVDAFIESLGPVSYLIDKNFIPNIKILGNINIKRIEETQLHFGVAKDNIMLRDILQKGLNAVTVDELKTIHQKWLPVNGISDKEEGFFKSSDLWQVIIVILILFVISFFGFKWIFKKFIKEKVALEFGSRKFRIQTNFYLTVLVIVIAAIGWLAIIYIEGEFNDNIKLQLENDLKSANGRLDFWLNQKKDYLKSFGHDQKLVDLTNELIEVSKNYNERQYNTVNNKLAQFFEEQGNQSSYIINQQGFNIGSINTSVINNLNNIAKSRPEFIKQVFRGEVVFVPPLISINDNPDNSQEDNSSKMYFLIPIEDIEHGVIAAIVQEINPELGFSEILQLSHVGETGESYVFNREGRMLSKSRFENELKTLGVFQLDSVGVNYIDIRDPGGNLTTGFKTKVPINKRSLTLMASSAVEGNSDINVEGYNDYRGVPVMGAWTWIDKLEIGLATEIDVEEALNLFYFIRLAAIIVLGFTLLIIIGSILFTLSLGEKANVALLKSKDELEERVELRTTELNNEKSLLGSLINAIPDLIFYKDTNFKFLGVNKAFEEQIGFKKEDFIGKTDRDFIPEELAKKFQKSDVVILEKLESVSMESEDVDSDGNKIVFDTKKSPFFNEAGKLLGLIGVSRDITVKKEADEEILKRTQELNDERVFLSTLMNSIPDLIFYKDINDNYLGANDSFLNQIGININDLKGKTDFDLLPLKKAKEFKKIDNEILKSLKPLISNTEEKDTDGNNLIFETRKTPFFNKKGTLLGLIGISRDITERKKAELRVKSQSVALKSTANGVVITNTKGEIVWVNPAFRKLTGYSWEELIGENPRILSSGKHDKAFYEEMWNTITAGETWHGEIINKKKDGTLFHEEMTITPILDDKGKIIQFVAIKNDITERKELEKILLKAKQRMEDELNVAKDIQMSMLPLTFPAFPKRDEIDIYAKLIPAREVGGDFYDFYFLDKNHLCFVMGDVSGKGVPAALMMAVTKTLLKSRAGNDKSTASILTHVNNEIAKDNDAYMFITVFLAILNTNTGELVYSNAGHNPSYVISKETKEITKLGDLHGPVIGAMEDMTYQETQLFLKTKGYCLGLYRWGYRITKYR